jgi:hypothetical protein
MRGGEDLGLIERAISGDGDAEAGSGEGVYEGSRWMVSIAFTSRGGYEERREEDRKERKQYRKG